jgi:hypothetical protein
LYTVSAGTIHIVKKAREIVIANPLLRLLGDKKRIAQVIKQVKDRSKLKVTKIVSPL